MSTTVARENFDDYSVEMIVTAMWQAINANNHLQAIALHKAVITDAMSKKSNESVRRFFEQEIASGLSDGKNIAIRRRMEWI